MSDVEDLFQRVGRKLKWFDESSGSLNISIDEKWKKARDAIALTSDSDTEDGVSYHSNKSPSVTKEYNSNSDSDKENLRLSTNDTNYVTKDPTLLRTSSPQIHTSSKMKPPTFQTVASYLSKESDIIVISSDEADDEHSADSDDNDDDVFLLPLKERLLRTCPAKSQRSRIFDGESQDFSTPSIRPPCKHLDDNTNFEKHSHTESKKGSIRKHHPQRPSFLVSSEDDDDDDDDDFEEFLARLKTPKKTIQFKGSKTKTVTSNTKKPKETEMKTKPRHIAQDKSNNQSNITQKHTTSTTTTKHNKDGEFLASLSAAGQTKNAFLYSHYVKDFKKNREELTQKLFNLYNQTVFENKLPSDMKITWNCKMRKTAGFCYYGRKSLTMERTVRIELADKVCDSAERVRDTLIHELCHAAAWYVYGAQDGHGRYWKFWTRKANLVHRELPIISRCHTYQINTKYNYQCMRCGTRIGRHSKSLDLKKFCCGVCGGQFHLLPTLRKDGTPAKTRTPNKFALYVKENYSTVKSKRKSMKHADVMRLLSAEFSTKASITN
ncbi:uncharacterized protein LOC144439202 [Glandiceps talaboti]